MACAARVARRKRGTARPSRAKPRSNATMRANEVGRERREYKESIKGKVADQRYYHSEKSKARDRRHRERKALLLNALERLDECMDPTFVRAMEATFAAR